MTYAASVYEIKNVWNGNYDNSPHGKYPECNLTMMKIVPKYYNFCEDKYGWRYPLKLS